MPTTDPQTNEAKLHDLAIRRSAGGMYAAIVTVVSLKTGDIRLTVLWGSSPTKNYSDHLEVRTILARYFDGKLIEL